MDPLDPDHQETLRMLAAVWGQLTDTERTDLAQLVETGDYPAAANQLTAAANRRHTVMVCWPPSHGPSSSSSPSPLATAIGL